MYSRKQLLTGLRSQLSHADKARRALLLIYSFQTAQEQSKRKTVDSNHRGFTTLDARILTGIALFYQSRGYLTPKQDDVVRGRMPKYAGQILSSSIERGLIRQVSPRRYEIVE